jgi:hypothetical protein
MTLMLETPADVGFIGSFTGQVRYDSTALSFIAEVPSRDGVLRAVNSTPGLVRIAAAAANGINPRRLAAFLIRVRDPRGVSTMTFEIVELHESGRADLTKRLERASQKVPR